MNMTGEISIGQNYRFIHATEDQILNILAKRFPIPTRSHRQTWLLSLQRGTFAAKEWLNTIKEAPEFLKGLRISEYHNLVPNVLRYELASLISGTTVTPTFKANYFALGAGSTAPANSDTALQSESTRSAFTNRSSFNNIAYLDVFFPSSVVGGQTYTEAGIFVDGTGSANSGYLLSRVLINQTLGSNQTLTINCSLTIS